MGQTSECIRWGLDDGLRGPLDTPTHMPLRVNGYLLPYLDGYMMGFLLRKVDVNEYGRETDAEWSEAHRLRDLMTRPRYRAAL